MNQYNSNQKLNGADISKTLSFFSTFILVTGIIVAASLFFIGLFEGISLSTEKIDKVFISYFSGYLIAAVAILFSSFLTSLLFKALSSIALHSYISAVNTAKIVERLEQRPHI